MQILLYKWATYQTYQHIKITIKSFPRRIIVIIVFGKTSYPDGKPVVKLLFIDDQFYYSYFRIHLIANTLEEVIGIFISWRVSRISSSFFLTILGSKINDREWYIKNRQNNFNILTEILNIFNYFQLHF